jgi:large subunit ribosomal protein L6
LRSVEATKFIQVPDGVQVKIDGRSVAVIGDKGTLSRDFSESPISLQLEDKKIRVRANWPRKKEAALVGTVAALVESMIKGVTKGFTYKLKIVFSHFPISVKVKDNVVSIENFTGERSPRFTKIIGNSKVIVKEDDVLVQGIALQDVSQTAANIERATKVKSKDPRVFLDGIFIYEKKEGMEP